MTRLSIDDQTKEFANPTGGLLGEVLQEVVAGLPPDRIVTRIVLDGKQLAKHAEDLAMFEEVAKFEELGIRTVDKTQWAASGVDIALSSIERMRPSLIRAADLFRNERPQEGNRFLIHCVEGLERFAEVIFVVRLACALDFSNILVEERTLAQVERDFMVTLRAILACQERADYQGIADGIEYGLLTNLSLWTKAFQLINNSQHSNA